MWFRVGRMERHTSLQGCISLWAPPDMSNAGALLPFVPVVLLSLLNKDFPRQTAKKPKQSAAALTAEQCCCLCPSERFLLHVGDGAQPSLRWAPSSAGHGAGFGCLPFQRSWEGDGEIAPRQKPALIWHRRNGCLSL